MNGPPASEITWRVGAMNVTLDHRGVTVTASGGAPLLLGAQVDALVDTITTAQKLVDSDEWWVPEGAGGGLPF